MQLHTFLLARDGDVLCVLANRNQRTRLDVVVSAVLHQIFDCLTRIGAFLHLVKHNHRLPFVQLHAILSLQSQENEAQRTEVIKHPLRFLACLVEVDEDIRAILLLGERFRQSRFAYTPHALDQQSRLSLFFLLSLQHSVVQFPLENELYFLHILTFKFILLSQILII